MYTNNFLALAMNVHELQASQQGLVASMHLQVGVDGPVVWDVSDQFERKNAYIYRVTDASATHEPATLAEVQTDVQHDLRRLALQEDHLKQAADLVVEAGRASLDTVGRRHKLAVVLTPEFTRLRPGRMNPYTGAVGEPGPMVIEPLGVVPEFTDAAFSLLTRAALAAESTTTHAPAASQKATATAPSTPVRVPATREAVATTVPQLSAADRLAIVPIDKLLQVLVLELYKSQAATLADFNAKRPSLQATARSSEVSRFLAKWHTLAETAKRVHFDSAAPIKASESDKSEEMPDIPPLQ